MLKLVRLFIVLALGLTVPVQAMSAVMAGLCMANDHHAGVTHSHDGEDQHSHAGDPGDASHAGHASSAHCPPCTACCAAAAIASAAFTFLPEAPAAAQIASRPQAAAAFQPDGLDRPPLAL